MAKIYGVELKNITNFKGHEGEPLIQGNIYNKKCEKPTLLGVGWIA